VPQRAPSYDPLPPLKTGPDDRTLVYGRPFKCKACGSREVTLFAIESQAELDALHNAMAEPPKPAKTPTTHPPRDPAARFV
jgi:hypothetical protein